MFEIRGITDTLYHFVLVNKNKKEMLISKANEYLEVLEDIEYCRNAIKNNDLLIAERGGEIEVQVIRDGRMIASTNEYATIASAKSAIRALERLADSPVVNTEF